MIKQHIQLRLLALEPLVQRMRVIAIDLDLGKERETHSIPLTRKLLDLLVTSRLLASELVAVDQQSYQTFRSMYKAQRARSRPTMGSPESQGLVGCTFRATLASLHIDQ
jgi:hypothetical protein